MAEDIDVRLLAQQCKYEIDALKKRCDDLEARLERMASYGRQTLVGALAIVGSSFIYWVISGGLTNVAQ